MLRRLLLVCLPLLVLFPRAAGASHECEFDGSVPGTVAKVYPVSAGGQVIYIDDRDYADADEDRVAGGIWLYLEANGIPGLQRGGFVGVPGAVPLAQDPCGGGTVPDTLLAGGGAPGT